MEMPLLQDKVLYKKLFRCKTLKITKLEALSTW